MWLARVDENAISKVQVRVSHEDEGICLRNAAKRDKNSVEAVDLRSELLL